ncbi:MAG TPA: ATP-binding cassette domain-containing protein, partial [Solirubrobacteraceae bacterium]|nr:ATP-binding cassette domain-containing protein [Solirubrobacteraceae bacterium]
MGSLPRQTAVIDGPTPRKAVGGEGGGGDRAAAATLGAEPVLRAEGLGKRFGSTVALHGVDFAAAAGERVAVIGPNGAGKTTLLSILAGVQPPSEGTVRHSGGAVGWAPQQPALYS